MTSKTKPDATEAEAWHIFCRLSKYRSANGSLTHSPEFTLALLIAHARWARLFAK